MIEVVPKILLYKSFRRFGYPKILPMNITLSVTDRCNSRCKTCNVWKIYKKNPKKAKEELALEEYRKIFANLRRLFWVTITGGEPFIRKDLKDIIVALYNISRPKFLTIATNAILTKKIVNDVKYIVKKCTKTKIFVNLSLDGVGEIHDKIRGVDGNFNKVLSTFKSLKTIQAKNLFVGVNSVVSKYNINHIPDLYSFVSTKMKPDFYICEIAENRAKLYNLGSDITPKSYNEVMKLLIGRLKRKKARGFVQYLVKKLRTGFYEQMMSKKIKDCYCGFASANIMCNGDVWMCYVRKSKIGKLRDMKYSFNELWKSNKAEEEREKVKNCSYPCKLVNAFYTNFILNWPIA